MSNPSSQSIATPIQSRNSVGSFIKLLRISNAPTVVTNSFVGASVAASMEPGSFPNIARLIAVTVGVVFIYIAGMAINDYFDQVVDAQERPTRPIPAGQISSSTALLVGGTFLLLGMILCAIISLDVLPWVMLLGSAVLAYNMLHLAKFVGPFLMGVCRALVPVVVAIALTPAHAPAWNILMFFALPLGLATFAISLAARNEIQINHTTTHAVGPLRSMRAIIATAFMGIGALAPLGAIATRTLNPMEPFMALTYVVCIALASVAIFRGLTLITSARASHIGVMHWIAALALLDGASLCILNQPILAYAAIGCFIATTLLQRRIAGS
ncbi:hypothetical protein LBMAG50_03660 [Phycisphaerae bacterium]|nr:hypothetical protein LBMAG50_03660 [Phycisphaerae bacterium]